MYLIPAPKELTFHEKNFYISRSTEIVLDYSCNFNDYESAKLLKSEIKKSTNIDIKINKAIKKTDKSIFLRKETGDREGYTIEISENSVVVTGNDDAGLFYGIQTLRQIIRQEGVVLPALLIKDAPYFKNRGFYHDVTRGKVPTLETLKELVDRLSFYKINQLQLYVEHTYAFKNFSEVWTGKDPLTTEEIMELDKYCKDKNVELVPSIATFGHLYEVLMTKTYNHLCELENYKGEPYSWHERNAHHTLDVSQEESIEFVKSMLEEFIPLFSSEKFNICCDETFDIGKGKSAKLAESQGVERLYVDFLKKIMEYVKTYDKQIMFWGDIIVKSPEYLKEISKDVVCLNWAYHYTVTEDDTKTLAKAGVKQYVCPGVGGWNRIMNSMDSAFININKMISYGKKYGAVGVLNTDWGDYGHVNLFGNSMPGMIYGAALSWNPEDNSELSYMDEAISTLEFGKDAKNIAALLRELSKKETDQWKYIVFFAEHKIIKNENIERGFKELDRVSEAAMTEWYHEARRLEAEILKEGSKAYSNRSIDIEEFIVSARGVALVNAACICIKKYEFKHEEIVEVKERSSLAVELEYWLADFSGLWRKRNKESELYRIRDMIKYLCNYIRDIK
ncbi:family 20 glycosylhydrolase [Clostridium sp. YIM B02515]|uniref:beta-N-acetylhexosaminidase n=1 Tax=Clostridium rhizosphaerae TaxID=2803861 RepID=A0ABS1T9Z4_9CLOT|nr:glycoside hydrolase family 20 zincin-like fold domain-containing protein [Clostridium rhizosphaerae]MBL4936165.1 family 20 glycosylhydrolase [Clostridium rhizosphaerae]